MSTLGIEYDCHMLATANSSPSSDKTLPIHSTLPLIWKNKTTRHMKCRHQRPQKTIGKTKHEEPKSCPSPRNTQHGKNGGFHHVHFQKPWFFGRFLGENQVSVGWFWMVSGALSRPWSFFFWDLRSQVSRTQLMRLMGKEGGRQEPCFTSFFFCFNAWGLTTYRPLKDFCFFNI